jgi:cyclic beta-1,2-glucan glucanotransferase
MASVHHSPLDAGLTPPPEVPRANRAEQRDGTVPGPRPVRRSTDDQLREQACQEARGWRLAGPGDSSRTFARELAIASKQIASATELLQQSVACESAVQDGRAVLLSGLLAVRSGVRECRDAFRSDSALPHIQCADGDGRIPRVYAASLGYLNASGEIFDETGFQTYAQGIQEVSPLQMSELWNLRSYLEFALLERIAEIAGRFQKPGSAQLTPLSAEHCASLRRCLESLQHVLDLDWKTLFEGMDETDRLLRTDPLGTYPQMDFESRDAYRSAVATMAAHSKCTEHEVAREAIALARQSQRDARFTGRAMERQTHVGYYLVGPGQKALKQRIGFRPPFWDRIRSVALGSPDYFYFIAIELIALALFVTLLTLLEVQPPAICALALLFLAVTECTLSVINTLVTTLLPPKKLPKLDFSEGIPADCTTIVAVPALLTSEKQVRKAVKDLEVRFLGNRCPNLHFALLTDPPDSRQQFDEKDALAGLCSELIEQLNRKYAGKKSGSFYHFHRNRAFNAQEGKWMGWERKRGKLLQFNRFLLGEEDSFPVKTGDLSILPTIRYLITLDVDTQLPAGAAHRLVGAIAHPLNSAVIDPTLNTVVEGYGILQPRVEISVRSANRSRLASLFSGDTGLDIYTRAVSDVYQDLFGEAIFSGKGIYEIGTFQKVLGGRLPCDAVLSHDLIEGAYARAGLVSDVDVVDDYPSNFSSLNRRKHRWMRGDWQISPWLFPRVHDASGQTVRNPISHVSRWKILDNLRRSVSDIAIFAALLYAWFAVPAQAMEWTLALLAVLFVPVYVPIALGILNARRELLVWDFWKSLFSDWASAQARIFFRLAFLCHQTLVALDAVGHSLIRMHVTHKHMLEWETAADAESATRGQHAVDKYLRLSSLLSLLVAALLLAFRPSSLLIALPFLLLWSALPKICEWLDKPAHSREPALAPEDRAMIRNTALRTWRFFREFSNEGENWLIPDIVQETPPLIAHQISTTNLGLLLNARLAALDFGFLTLGEFITDTEKTFQTVARMPKCNGHLYNWYATDTLEPKEPLFISTVDNGNLLCSLWTLKEGCLEVMRQPIFRPALWQGIHDFVDLLAEIIEAQPAFPELCRAVRDLKQRVDALSAGPADAIEILTSLEIDTAIFLKKLQESSAGDEIRWWAGEFAARVKHLVRIVQDVAPWVQPEYAVVLARLGSAKIPRLGEISLESSARACAAMSDAVSRLAESSGAAKEIRVAIRLRDALARSAAITKELSGRLAQLATAAQSLADEMDFGIFFDSKREMLSIGFDAAEHCISKWHYDLLPSEARSAAFGAIAQGSIPHKLWFRLGRFYGDYKNDPVLLSWTGTMFEYLMPFLWTRSYPNTLLERGARAAIAAQRKFARQRRTPWGMSECACNDRSVDGHYVYRALGVADLAIHQDEFSSDVVVAPYATFLAMMFEPSAAAQNLAEMTKLGWLGPYGFYDAADFTPHRVSGSKSHEIVRTWMAHHQGMSLMAICNVLCDSAMQRRFHADARVAAAERVLHEKMPRVLPHWEPEVAVAFQPARALASIGELAGQLSGFSATAPGQLQHEQAR